MNIDEAVFQKIGTLFSSYQSLQVPGFAIGILNDVGELIHHAGFGQANLELLSPITKNTVFDIGSMAKQFVGFLIAILIDEGKLSPTQKLSSVFPSWPKFYDNIEIQHLLYHTSGLWNYTTLCYYIIGYHETDAPTKEEIIQILQRQPKYKFHPGSQFEYNDSNYFLLALLLERILHKPIDLIAKERIFDPLQMHQTLFRTTHAQVIPNRAASYVSYPIKFTSPYTYDRTLVKEKKFFTKISNYEHVGAEGVFSSVNDLAIWQRNLLNNILGKNPSHVLELFISPGELNSRELISYGYGIEIHESQGKSFIGHCGAFQGYTSCLLNYSTEFFSIIVLGNHLIENAWNVRDKIASILRSNENSTQKEPKLNNHEKIIPNSLSRGFIGRYQNPDTSSIISIEEICNKLCMKINSEVSKPFQYQKDGNLYFNSENWVQFSKFVKKIPKILKYHLGSKILCFERFVNESLLPEKLTEYLGEYHCEILNTSFQVRNYEGKLLLKNKNPHFCSLDLLYTPTIPDSFESYDPHPYAMFITFQREKSIEKSDRRKIISFTYRDYDGDKREEFEFKKL
ncbi:D-aminopeptidase [Candidatus Lokiarchaeum ossiferum]|uniref:D-aminopeptidase n=1 Tax=Candidatus Lokiarchaeum ossiferum TaxID=2951803 RepID=A0ABY6HQ40_9ARCH|nr:D-aminopeptidase [Candidatus Lokiarchaeum sp. B-35]